MPLKRKGKKKKSPTMTAQGGLTGSSSDDKKPKKKKLTRAEKALANLEKKCDLVRKSEEQYKSFIEKWEKWLSKNGVKAAALLLRYDDNGNGVINYDEFKSGMFDLNAPYNEVELHLLCQFLDNERTNEIEYPQLATGLKHTREKEKDYEQSDIRPVIQPTKELLAEPPTLKYPRYIKVLFKLVTFDNFRQHPGHFSQIVPSHISSSSLMQIIRDETKTETTKLAIFTDKSRNSHAMLPPHVTLEECGFYGGPRDDPQELLLYYDYKVEFTDCPILMCDHYFGRKLNI